MMNNFKHRFFVLLLLMGTYIQACRWCMIWLVFLLVVINFYSSFFFLHYYISHQRKTLFALLQLNHNNYTCMWMWSNASSFRFTHYIHKQENKFVFFFFFFKENLYVVQHTKTPLITPQFRADFKSIGKHL